MFANCQMGGMNFAFPDVCLTPVPMPVPIPYPNFALGMTANPATACKKIYLSCMPAHNLMTMIPLSLGDNAGVNLGVASGMVMGPSRHLMGSFGVIYEGLPATKMTSPTGQNGLSLNMLGLTIVPAQFKVMIMK
ncbi:MAG: DUF4150 domain-containing protein [Planctomycetota bacterium]